MDIYTYLKTDHAKVAQLFQLFEPAPTMKRKQQIVALILLELEIHTEIEQETFYNTLAQYVKTQADARQGKEKHQEIQAQIDSIRAMPLGPNWETAVLKLKTMVEQHVREEETQMFEDAQAILSEQEAQQLKKQAQALRENLLVGLSKEQIKGQESLTKTHIPKTQNRQSGHTSL